MYYLIHIFIMPSKNKTKEYQILTNLLENKSKIYGYSELFSNSIITFQILNLSLFDYLIQECVVD